MPTPTISNVWRVVLLWNGVAGITPRNIFHVRTLTSDVADLAGFINDAFQDAAAAADQFHGKHGSDKLTAFSLQPLDGATAATDWPVTPNITPPGTGEVVPSTCSVVSFKTAQLGPRGRGRMYVGPLIEGDQADGVTSTTLRTQQLAGWDTFIDSLDGNGVKLVVASYAHADAHDVVTVRIDRLIGNQRRRQDQLR